MRICIQIFLFFILSFTAFSQTGRYEVQATADLVNKANEIGLEKVLYDNSFTLSYIKNIDTFSAVRLALVYNSKNDNGNELIYFEKVSTAIKNSLLSEKTLSEIYKYRETRKKESIPEIFFAILLFQNDSLTYTGLRENFRYWQSTRNSLEQKISFGLRNKQARKNTEEHYNQSRENLYLIGKCLYKLHEPGFDFELITDLKKNRLDSTKNSGNFYHSSDRPLKPFIITLKKGYKEIKEIDFLHEPAFMDQFPPSYKVFEASLIISENLSICHIYISGEGVVFQLKLIDSTHLEICNLLNWAV